MTGVAIFGGTQPLGRRLAERLLAATPGREVLLVGIEEPGSVPVTRGSVHLQVDLTDAHAVERLMFRDLRAHGVGAVVALAFHRDPRGGRAAHRLNVEGTRLLLQLAERHPTVRQFVHRSTTDVYARYLDRPHVVREDQPLELDPRSPQWVRDRVEADVTVSARMGLCEQLRVSVLRCSEILAPDMGSQVYDYLGSRVCLRPMGFDPMVNVLSLEDAARAFELALRQPVNGALNIVGADSLPLSQIIRRWGRVGVAVPGPLIGPLYAARRVLRKTRFRYGANAWSFHFNAVPDGTRAEAAIGYRPEHRILWPSPTAPTG